MSGRGDGGAGYGDGPLIRIEPIGQVNRVGAGAGVDQALSEWSDLLGRDVKHREAMEQRAFEIELRVGELNLAKGAAAKAKSGVTKLADSLGGMPSGKTPPYLEAWAATMNELVASNLADAPRGRQTGTYHCRGTGPPGGPPGMDRGCTKAAAGRVGPGHETAPALVMRAGAMSVRWVSRWARSRSLPLLPRLR